MVKAASNPQLLKLFAAGSLAGLIGLFIVKIAAEVFSSTGDYGGLAGLGQTLGIAAMLRLSVLPVVAVVAAVMLRVSGQKQNWLATSAITGAGGYIAFGIIREFSMTDFRRLLVFGLACGVVCVVAGLVAFAFSSLPAQIVVAAFFVLAAYLLTPVIVKPIHQWQDRKNDASLEQYTINNADFKKYVVPDPTVDPVYHTDLAGNTILRFGAKSFTTVLEGGYRLGQDYTIDPPNKCNITRLYKAMGGFALWRYVYGGPAPGCELIVTTAKGRMVYGEKPPLDEEPLIRAYYTRIGQTNIVMQVAKVYVDERGAGFADYIGGIVDSLEEVDGADYPVSDH